MKTVVVILICLVVFSAGGALAGKPAPPPPAGPWEIAYGSLTNGGGDLSLMKSDGQDKQVVYTCGNPHYARLPDWSHDGKYVSFNVYNIEGRVLEVATGKTCLLYNPHGTAPQAIKFHPSFGAAVGDGRYVAAWTNWNNESYDLYIVEFKFQEGVCPALWSDNVSRSVVGEWGAAWSPIGTAQRTQLATLVQTVSPSTWTLRVHDVVQDVNGHLALTGTFIDYPLDNSLSYPAGFGGGWSLQWSPDPNVLGVIAKWSPDGGVTKYADVYTIDIRTNPPIMTNVTNTPANESYFDFRPNGDGMVVGNDDGIFRFPKSGSAVCIAPVERRRFPKDPAWNPTRP